MNPELLIIGMSPGNSYFSQETINRLLEYAVLHYKNIEIIIPDVPAISTYVALGYPENIARREKAMPQGNAFRNRIQKTMQQEHLSYDQVHVIDWKKENFEEKINYQREYGFLKNLYDSNESFRKDINEATSQVLFNNPLRKREITPNDIQVATHYIISEFAFMLFLPEIRAKYKIFAYAYHKPWPVWEKFISGEYDGKSRDNLKFVLLPDFSA